MASSSGTGHDAACGERFEFHNGDTLYTSLCELPEGHKGAHSLASPADYDREGREAARRARLEEKGIFLGR